MDSDDEEYDTKRKFEIEKVLSRYDKEKILFEEGKFITDTCRDKYLNTILTTINRR